MKVIYVDLSHQILYAYEGNKLFRKYDCVTGDKSHKTTVGTHRIGRKHRIYRSRQYDAQMNFAMFFHRGEAIHESHLVGPMSYARITLRSIGLGDVDPFGSHGCVRLESSNARELFNWTPIRTKVVISRNLKLPI
ncbi:MAG: L,D-transpeptidase [Saprospiraceae bacterium]|nr:L,D-transpeptidase [Saprospiraceae bacterium]